MIGRSGLKFAVI